MPINTNKRFEVKQKCFQMTRHISSSKMDKMVMMVHKKFNLTPFTIAFTMFFKNNLQTSHPLQSKLPHTPSLLLPNQDPSVRQDMLNKLILTACFCNSSVYQHKLLIDLSTQALNHQRVQLCPNGHHFKEEFLYKEKILSL